MTFNIFKIKLEGLHLIEASAGTGKTYSLCGLFFRLLLEKKINFRQILLITFTILATEELKKRIYDYLEKSLSLISLPLSKKKSSSELTDTLPKVAKDDEILSYILNCYLNDNTVLKNLQDAVSNFQEIPIYTLDGFWSKLTQEYAFEMANMVDRQLIDIVQTNETITQILNTYYQEHFVVDHRETTVLNKLLFKKDSRFLISLKKVVLENREKDNFKIYRINKYFHLSDFEKNFLEHSSQIKPLLKKINTRINTQKQILLEIFSFEGLNKTKYRNMGVFLEKLFSCFQYDDMGLFLGGFLEDTGSKKDMPKLLADFSKLSLENLKAGLKKNYDLPPSFYENDIASLLRDFEECYSVLKKILFSLRRILSLSLRLPF